MEKTDARKILKRMQEVLIAEFPEFEAKFGHTKFSQEGSIDFKFSLVEKNAVDSINKRELEIGMVKNDVHPKAIGVTVDLNGEMHTIESVRTRKQKYCVIAKRLSDGKKFRFQSKIVNKAVKLSLMMGN